MDIPPGLLNGVSVVGLLVVTYWLLVTDRIVTGPAHRREIADKDAQIVTLTKTIAVKDDQLEKLSVVGETQLRILTAVEGLAKERAQ